MTVRPALMRDKRGVVLIEFAMIASFLILLFLGGYNVASAMALSRKAATATHDMADLVGQVTKVSKSDLAAIIAIKDPILAPFKLNETTTRISEVKTNSYGQGTVAWSYAGTGTALVKGASYTLPSDFQQANLTYILTDVEYVYNPQMSVMGNTPYSLSEHVITLPRLSQDITCSDC